MPSWRAGLRSGFELFATGMHHELVGFLNGGRVRAGDHDRGVALLERGASVSTKESDPKGTATGGRFQGRQEVGASSGGAEDDEAVVGAEEGFARTTEDGFEAVVVGDAGEGAPWPRVEPNPPYFWHAAVS